VDKTDAVMDLAKRRGFLYPSYELYGGMAGFYDYGPLGAAMKRRFEDLWRHTFMTSAVPVAEVKCPRVTMHEVLKASGHVDEFTDLVVRCANGHPSRADHLIEGAGYEGATTADALSAEAIDEQIVSLAAACPVCKDKVFTPAAPMNLMFNTEIGPGSGRNGYLRPETAQGIFTDFPHLLRHFRGKLPFAGIQLGGSNRNEISPRQGMLRLREFHMMEAEVFFLDTDAPFPAFGTDARCTAKVTFIDGEHNTHELSFREAVAAGIVGNEALAYFMALTYDFLVTAGMDATKLRFRQHEADEMAHYANDCWDAEFESERYGWVECVGIADRGSFDLEQHAAATGKRGDFQVNVQFDEPYRFTARKLVPVMGVLGKTFKGDAKKIGAALEAVFDEQVKMLADSAHATFDAAWLNDELNISGPKETVAGDVDLDLEIDGETMTIPANGYMSIDGEWKVNGRKVVPRVIEPSFGVDRILYALWEHAHEQGEKNGEPYTVMHLSPAVAPIHVAILPLTGKDGMPAVAMQIEQDLRAGGMPTDYDDAGNIGRRYARQDEVGTPWCITIDPQSMQDQTVTVRNRDTTEQDRVPITDLTQYLSA
jgi:glycyl-tRNA synthetase